jgi:hypothetical protein
MDDRCMRPLPAPRCLSPLATVVSCCAALCACGPSGIHPADGGPLFHDAAADSGGPAGDTVTSGDGAPGDAPARDGGPGEDVAPNDGTGLDTVPADAVTPDAPAVPLNGIFNVRDFGALGDDTADDTAAIQATIAAADAATGGIVYVPAGRYRIKGNLSVGAAISLQGEGFTPPAGDEASLAGSWLVVDASLTGASAITLGAAGASVRDLGIWHQQPAPGPGWAPRGFGWAIDMTVPDTLVRHVWLANPTLGVRGIGRVTIENLAGQPITTGIRIEYAYDVVRLRRIRFNWTADGGPVWSADPSVTSKLGTAIESLRNDNPQIHDVRVAGYATGFHFGSNADATNRPGGATSKFALMDTMVNGATRCVTIDGSSTTGKLDRFKGQGCGVTGLWITPAGTNSVVSAADLDLRQMSANAVRVEGANAFFLVNQLTVVNWNTSGAGFPALEAAAATATVKVGYFHSLMGSTAPATGGVGHATVDTNAADAFDLRVPTPTAVAEDAVKPFAAVTDVVQHGATGDGTTDDTAAIQAALDATASGQTVLVPSGDYLLKGGLRVPQGVALVGVGWNVSGSRGVRFHVDAANRADVVQLADHATLQNVAFRWDQGTPAAGWTPTPFGWAVKITGTGVVVRDVFMLNPTRGIEIASTGTGSVLLDRVAGSPVGVGLHVDSAAAIRVNDVHFWPFWYSCFTGCGAGTAGDVVNNYILTHAVGYQLDHSAHAEVSNIFSIGYATGVLLGANAAGGVNTDLRLWNADQDIFGARGYVVQGPGTQATFANWNAQGNPPNAITGLWAAAAATGAKIDGYNGDLRLFTANAVRSDAAGSQLRVNLMRLEGWNSSGRGFPAVEGSGGASVVSGPQDWENGQ